MQRLEATYVAATAGTRDIRTSCLAWLGLVAADVVMKCAGFRVLHRIVTHWSVSGEAAETHAMADNICATVDRAALYYFKHARCLQRSAVMTCLLRRRGVPAQMVIGCRKMPFHGHAWVEVDGRVVNDTQKVQEFYSVLDRW